MALHEDTTRQYSDDKEEYIIIVGKDKEEGDDDEDDGYDVENGDGFKDWDDDSFDDVWSWLHAALSWARTRRQPISSNQLPNASYNYCWSLATGV